MAALLVLGLALSGPSVTTANAAAARAGSPAHTPSRLTITSVSNPHPSLVSGGDVLLKVTIPPGAHPDDVRVTANGQDVTGDFSARSDSSLLGLVDGLTDGPNAIRASIRQGQSASLTVDNHPITGPVFSGKRQQPFYCQSTSFGLPAATPPLCTTPTQVTYQYRTTAGSFAPLADPTSRPADLATTTVNGRTVPYIIRLEQGTIDRAVYQVAALYDGRKPTPTTPDTSWNGKLIYTFGGGCNSGYRQGTSTGGVMNDQFLSKGYAVASSTLNVLDQNCSSVISAEAAMMVKEHFIETYGPVQFTMGWGGSGGAIQQYTIADSYPGILDGIIPSISFPDPLTTGMPVTDCRLLDTFFAGAGADWTPAQKAAVAGYNDVTSCRSWDVTFANRATATGSCDPAIPAEVRWDPVTNPHGVICNSAVQLVNQLGTDPQTGFPNSVLDSVGVQYGLKALQSGTITPEQFITINEKIGGIDYAGNPQAGRTEGSTKGLAAAYADGLVTYGSQGLRTTAIIDHRTDLDFAGLGNDIHTSEWSFVARARLLERNGTSANQVIIESQPTADQTAAANEYVLDEMDAWLTAVKADHTGRSLQAKIIKDRPTSLSDGCYLSATNLVHQPLTDPATGACAAAYPIAGNPRTVAGQPLPMSQLKCQLVPLDRSSYGVTFTDEQWARLRAAFPTGVCDYSVPGVGQRAPIAPWLSYGSDPNAVSPPVPVP